MSGTSPPQVTSPAAAISPGGLLADAFRGPTWNRWRAVLKAANGEPLDDAELALFREVAERAPPTKRVRELWAIAGRWSGKDSIASAIACVAALGDYREHLRPGERPVVLCLASDREQAEIVKGYICGYFQEYPILRPLVAKETADGLELTTGVVVQVGTANFRAVRGRTVVCAILDEVGLWRTDAATAPDIETYTALVPAMARVPGSMLVGISTPYRRAGLLYERHQHAYGKPDPDVLVVLGRTTLFNPGADQRIIDADLARDPEKAGAEWLAEWRNDLSDFITRDLLDAATDRGVVVRPPLAGVTYGMFIDSAAGRGDSFTAAIAHAEGDQIVLDAVYERRAPFNPGDVVAELAELALSYGVTTVRGDRYGEPWIIEAFAKHGIRYVKSEQDRSAIYLNVAPLFTSGRARLIDSPRLFHQFASLERRSSRFGKDRVDHPGAAGGADDLANAAAGAMVLVETDRRPSLIRASLLHPEPGEEAPALGYLLGLYALLWSTPTGASAWAIFGRRNPHLPHPLLLIDAGTETWSGALPDAVATRLVETVAAARAGHRACAQNGVRVAILCQPHLVPPARSAARRAFDGVAGAHGGRIEQIDAAMLGGPASWGFAAAAAVAAGAVKLAATAIERSRSVPLLAALTGPAGADVADDPLRMVLLLGIAMTLNADAG